MTLFEECRFLLFVLLPRFTFNETELLYNVVFPAKTNTDLSHASLFQFCSAQWSGDIKGDRGHN